MEAARDATGLRVKPLIGTAGLPEARGGPERLVIGMFATFVCTSSPFAQTRYARQGIRCTDSKKLGSFLKLMPADSTPAAPS